VSKKRKIIFETTDPQGRNIVLDDYRWKHIQRHPEITKIPRVKNTIQNPDFIMENTSRSSKYYVTISDLSLYFNVVAKIDDKTNAGSVTTAYITSHVLEGDVIWKKTSKA